MRSLDFGAPFSRFSQLLGGNFALFLILGLVGIILPSLAVSYGLQYYIGFTTADFRSSAANLSPATWGWLAGGGILLFLLKLINLSMVTEFAILRAVNKPTNVGAALGNAFGNILPLFAVSILVGLMVAGGMFLLIVPGVIWSLASCVAIPAYVGERGIGIIGAINRSFALTRNNRGTLLGVFIVCLVLLILIGIVFGVVIGGTAIFSGGGDPTATMAGQPGLLSVAQALNVAFDALIDILSNIFIAAVYVSLRDLSGNRTTNEAAAVFE